MFLQSLGKYLHARVETRTNSTSMYAYGRASLLHYARWMAEHEHPYLEKPEKLEFPTETWAGAGHPQERRLHVRDASRPPADRARFAERGRFFHRYSVETLAARPTKALARPVVVLLDVRLHAGVGGQITRTRRNRRRRFRELRLTPWCS